MLNMNRNSGHVSTDSSKMCFENRSCLALVAPPPSIVTLSVQVPYEAGMVPAPRAPAICAIQPARAVAADSQEKER